MRTNEIAKDRSSTAIEKGPLHLLLELSAAFAPKSERIFVQSEENHIRTY
jgi:hypothetical protein